MGDLQEKQGVISLPATAPSQAIVDVSENMRAKIYALFCKLGTIQTFIKYYSETVWSSLGSFLVFITRTMVLLGFIELPGLTTEDHVTLTIIEHYLDFKVRELKMLYWMVFLYDTPIVSRVFARNLINYSFNTYPNHWHLTSWEKCGLKLSRS